ncbi:tetracycline regulation of excision, RteC [Pontibacter qinzhouensis]|uniref:Tetracycline regulation of excision, RteC n=1 Tax=Pontibacter qinzhouensis TaxID=2603253 RepID=A0A5C8JDK4_9BACT|nr:RteC domain-containing protein [Pontibacter qinzhouensis]TXK36450.1 tetracycline regulation of excision, RteC [Pontibacter qinzhouensis]
MKQQAEKLYDQLEGKLRDSELEQTASPARRRETNLQLINETIRALKDLVIHHHFTDEQEEIHFFKHVKPRFTSLLIYHARLALIELKKPAGTLKDIRRHYERELLLIRTFHDHHLQLYQYLRADATFLDSKLFVRGSCDLPYHYATSAVDTDTRFSTHYDYVVARLQANEQLRHYLIQALQELQTGKVTCDQVLERKELSWTGSKVHLIELAYALYESGQINNGSIHLNELVTQLESIFRVRLGNVYRTFQEMRQRKKDSRTKFLDLMREKLEYRMDELDAL